MKSSLSNRKKRCIVIIGPTPPPYAGPEICTANILNSKILREKFSLNHLNTQKHTRNEQKGTVSWRNIVWEIKHAFLLAITILRMKPKIVFLLVSQTDLGFCRDAVFILISKILRRKVTLYLPSGAYDIFYGRSRFPLLVKFAFRISDKILVLSEAVKRQLNSIIETEDPEKIRIIPLDIHFPSSFDRLERKERSTFRVVHLGHISVAKGAVDVVRAIPQVIREFPQTKFLFAGDYINIERNIDFIPDPHEAEYKINNLVEENNLERYVDFLGVVTGEDKAALLKSADILVLASYSEGLPRAVLEGMLAGLPVVVTRLHGLEGIVHDGENGFVVNFGQPSEIAESICRLLRDSELCSTIGKRNRLFVEENFSPVKTDLMLRRIFGELCGEP